MLNFERDRYLIRVVDDDKDLLKSLKFALEVDGWSVKTFSSAEDFLDNPDLDIPGCIVLDIRMDGLSGVELQEEILEHQSLTPIIFLTGHGDMNTAIHVFRQGAFDFLQKPVDAAVFAETVEKAVQKSDDEYHRRQQLSPLSLFQELTDRQKDVLKYMAEGSDNIVIAERLGISNRTLQRHRQNAMKKLGLKTLTDVKQFIDTVRKEERGN